MAPKVVIVGGGWAGTGAAVAAIQAGAKVVILERTDMLLGTGLVGGIMRNNGRFTATEEAIAMGLGDIFHVLDNVTARHKNINFPGHKHANLYDIAKTEPEIKKMLLSKGVTIKMKSRVKDVVMEGTKIKEVVLDSGETVTGDVFFDGTGTAGPYAMCNKYGNGCAMCVIRCHSYGGRISLAAKAGVQEFMGIKEDGSIGAMSGSCKLLKESLSEDIQKKLNETGVAVIPIPVELQKGSAALTKKACQQYALPEYNENIILLDTGHAKLMSPFYPLDMLRAIPGFENARYEDPYAGDMGNSMRYMAMSPRDNSLHVIGVDNLFCGGEKAGPLVGHTEAIITGALGGSNAVRYALGQDLVVVPETLAIGMAIAHVNDMVKTKAGLGKKYTFSGSVLFKRMQEKNLYIMDIDEIKNKVEQAGMGKIFAKKLN